MALTENGASTTEGRGEFRGEYFWSDILGRELYQWDYRDWNGKLYSGVARSEDEAREKAARAVERGEDQ